ncbi:MAG: sigma-54-dependent Fis family transcriptional regulator [Flavobacteriales bacterium]|jgi:transcriptional regulator with PAS, ATPase and Fis domain|nr:sigma-54-dependent Fis family transcriptional regulator [Flavobacteriales bacterium]MBT3962841.1 sigma-54-dependent Fis family transcriptional regulator [Flavobacteriales bacterium]MBT4704824.1 sigma-54-dependent Fis family transcriptional regulator [Flavobacteriales bacterium]MBT4929599.1 sigma-54-dependent Fis family transcriptional regulator [Flavobacteriales bacterium]MBT5132959.1 sigma-54-dependent Fis family transcriptional regulator [Flavobacteriales bacterium]
MNVQQAKQRFGIIGVSATLDRAIETALRVSPTDLSVLITGESGTGKEAMPQIIHHNSTRKHSGYIAVNCGAIPEGTIDSELFGHEKGSFTGAHDTRKGYFEVADGGTIFLDEVAELPVSTQVRLLRVLETGEFLKVGSSKSQKTDVRIVAATNVDIPEAIRRGKFREDLYYRLNTVPIHIPPLRERKEDIHLLFRKFASDFGEKYRMPGVRLIEDSVKILSNYRWPGNIRQLKNVTEQISVIESEREISAETLLRYLPHARDTQLPMVLEKEGSADMSEREILYKVLFDLKNEMTDLKKIVMEIIRGDGDANIDVNAIKRLYPAIEGSAAETPPVEFTVEPVVDESNEQFDESIVVEESLSIEEKEKELIIKALDKHKGRRKNAAQELGISERTLYRKIKEYELP